MRPVIVILLLIVAAGCSDPEPREPTSTASATPTVTEPTMPAQAMENTPEGAAAFVHYYIDVLNHASSTGDVSELSRLSDSACSGCHRYIELYRSTYAAGGKFTGGHWSPGEMHLDFGEPETYVTTTIAIAAGEVMSGPGEPPEPEKPSTSTVSFGISGSPWSVTQFGLGETK